MEAYGLGDCMDLLPPLIESADIAGTVTDAVAMQTGLAAGTPVIGGLFDVVASALGSGVTRTGSASIIAGTWSINQVIIDGPDLDGPVFMSLDLRSQPLYGDGKQRHLGCQSRMAGQGILRRRAHGRGLAV